MLSTSPIPTLSTFDEEMRNLHRNSISTDEKKSRPSTCDTEKSYEFTISTSGEKAVQTDPVSADMVILQSVALKTEEVDNDEAEQSLVPEDKKVSESYLYSKKENYCLFHLFPKVCAFN